MPPYLTRECSKCLHLNSYDWVQLNQRVGQLYIGPQPSGWPREFLVTCKQCGHEFIILVYKDEVSRE